jgi:hypothetical protein
MSPLRTVRRERSVRVQVHFSLVHQVSIRHMSVKYTSCGKKKRLNIQPSAVEYSRNNFEFM